MFNYVCTQRSPNRGQSFLPYPHHSPACMCQCLLIWTFLKRWFHRWSGYQIKILFGLFFVRHSRKEAQGSDYSNRHHSINQIFVGCEGLISQRKWSEGNTLDSLHKSRLYTLPGLLCPPLPSSPHHFFLISSPPFFYPSPLLTFLHLIFLSSLLSSFMLLCSIPSWFLTNKNQ